MHVHEYKQGYIRDVKLNSLNWAGNALQCFKVAIVLAIKFSKSFVDVESASNEKKVTKEILICPTTDHQQQIVSLSENKERPETNDSLY